MSKTPQTIQLLADIQDKIGYVKAYLDSSECPESDKQDLIIELGRISTITAKPVASWEKNLKAMLEVNNGDFTDESNGYHYFWKTQNRTTFDADKAKSKLVELDYVIDDFMKSTTAKSLQFEKVF